MKTSVMCALAAIGTLSALQDAFAGSNFGFGYSASTITTSQTYGAPVYAAPAPPAPVAYGAQPYCREYNGQVIVGGRYQQSYGTACMQPDGAWQISTPNGIGTPVGYIQPPMAYAAPPTYYAPAPIYTAPAYPYTRSSFNLFYRDNDWDRGRRGWGHGHRGNDWRGGHKYWRDDWRGRGRGHGRGHGNGHWR